MAQTDILRNYLNFSPKDVENSKSDKKKNDVKVKTEALNALPQRFNCAGLDLTFHHYRSDGHNTIFTDAEYFLKHYVYKLMPITFEEKNEKKDLGKNCSETVKEEIDEKLISLEHDYCSVSSESDGEFEFSRMISYQVYKTRSRYEKKGRIKQTVKESPTKTCEIDITNKNGSNTDLHLIQPDYSELSFNSKNLFSYKVESHSEGLQPIALSISLPEEKKTDNEIASPTENNEGKEIEGIESPTENAETNLSAPLISTAPSILSPTVNNVEKGNPRTNFSVAASVDENKGKENEFTNLSVLLSPAKNDKKKVNISSALNTTAILPPREIKNVNANSVANESVPTILSPTHNEKEKLSVTASSRVNNSEEIRNALTSAELSIPEPNIENQGENDNIEVRFSRPGFNEYKPTKQFIRNIAKKVPDLLKDKSDKVNILDCTYGIVNSDNKINYYFISEEIWRLFINSSERIVLTNDTNCGKRVEVNKENDIPTFLVFDEASLADVLKTICKDIGYKYQFTLLEDSGEKLVKILEKEDCVKEKESEVEERELLNDEKCDEQPLGFVNSGKLRNLMLKSSRLKLRDQIGESGRMCGTSLNYNRSVLPLKKSWKKDELLLVRNAEERVVELWENSRKKARKKSKRYGIINSGLLKRMLLRDNPCNELTKRSNNLVSGIPVNQNNLMCSQMPFASQKVKKNKKKDERKKSTSKNRKTANVDGILDLSLHLGNRTGFGEEELINKKKKKKGKNKKNENSSLVNKATDNLKENNSILCKLLQEPVLNNYVPEYQSTEYYLDEKSGILSVRNVIDRNKLERALLSEKMREVRVGGLKKKREREMKNKEQNSLGGDQQKMKVKKSKKKKYENCEMKVSNLIENVVKNSIVGYPSCDPIQIQEPPSTSVQIREPPYCNSIQGTGTNHTRDQLEEGNYDRYQSRQEITPNNEKRKRGRPPKEPEKIKKSNVVQKEIIKKSIEKEKMRRLSEDSCKPKRKFKVKGGRPRKNNDLYSQCYMFEPSYWMENQAQIKQLLENPEGVVQGKESEAKKGESKTKKKERRNTIDNSFSVNLEPRDAQYSEVNAERRFTRSFSGTVENYQEPEARDGLAFNKSLEFESKKDQSSRTEASDESTITAFNDSREEPFYLNDSEEKIYGKSEKDDHQIAEKDNHQEEEQDNHQQEEGDNHQKDEEDNHRNEENDTKDGRVGDDGKTEKPEEEITVLSDDPLIPIITCVADEGLIPFYLKARKESEAKKAETEAKDNTPSPNHSTELEKGEVCFGRDDVEAVEDGNISPVPSFNLSEIKKELTPEKVELEAAETEGSNEEKDDVQEEKPKVNVSLKKETKNKNFKRKSGSKTKAKKAKKRIKEENIDEAKSPIVSLAKNESVSLVVKSPIIAKKGKLLIETNKISPIVQIEKNKEIEEAISKQLEGNSLSPVRTSSRPKKVPRIFDESEYAVVTPAKKVKKSPEKNVDPDYHPKMKTRRGGQSNESKPSQTPPTEKLPKSPESDSVSLQRIIDLSEKKNRIELFDPLSLNYERTTRSGTKFEKADSLEESEPEVVQIVKKTSSENSTSNNKKNNSRRNTICSTKGQNSTIQKPEQRTISTRSSQNSRHTVGSIEKEKSKPNTRFSARLKNV